MNTIDGDIPIKIWVNNLDEVEASALQQLKNIAKLPGIFKHVAAMPDVHLGIGATVGSVLAFDGIIPPSAVGVDIGCGMLAVPLNKPIDMLYNKETFDKIENSVPLGPNGHRYPKNLGPLKASASLRVQSVWQKAFEQLGTLGGGNHFIEICSDTKNNAWLMLHSWSRNVGNEVARIHVRNAKAIMKIQQIKLADPDLAYLTDGTTEFSDYLEDLHWCQQYAYQNRQTMLRLVLSALEIEIDPKTVINCHHNYAEVENHFNKDVLVVRKGAVRARQGDLGIIPGSMGQKSYIVKGLGNPESFCSCSHGAGRTHSRTKAKELFTEEDLVKQTEGVFCRKDRGVLDEIPSAYKNLDTVMDNQKDLVSIVETLKAVVTVKG